MVVEDEDAALLARTERDFRAGVDDFVELGERSSRALEVAKGFYESIRDLRSEQLDEMADTVNLLWRRHRVALEIVEDATGFPSWFIGIARTLYWEHPELSVPVIGRVLGVTAPEVHPLVGTFTVTDGCWYCNEPVSVVFTSREKMRHGGPLSHDPCREEANRTAARNNVEAWRVYRTREREYRLRHGYPTYDLDDD